MATTGAALARDPRIHFHCLQLSHKLFLRTDLRGDSANEFIAHQTQGLKIGQLGKVSWNVAGELIVIQPQVSHGVSHIPQGSRDGSRQATVASGKAS